MSKEYLETLNNTFDYGVQSVLDGLLIRGYNPKKMLEQECLGNTLEKDLDEAKIKITDLTSVKKYMVKSQDLEKENARYKELEKQIGCPLEVRCRVVFNSIIYNENGEEYSDNLIYDDNFVGYCLRPNSYGFLALKQFKWNDYKKTWWLKADKSE